MYVIITDTITFSEHTYEAIMNSCSVKNRMHTDGSCAHMHILKRIKNRGSYRSAHVLLNSLNELGKRDKMLSKPRNFILFSQRVK